MPNNGLRSRERGTYSKESRPGSAGYRIVAADGLMLWAYDQAMLVCGSNGASRFWQDVVIDMSESQRAVEALRESEARLHSFLSSLADVVFELDENGTYLGIWTTNDALLAAPRSELLGRTHREAISEEIGLGLAEVIGQVFETGRPQIW